ncbi:TonB-dependent receptor [Massilia timonae]|uniref:TonB-dependent siderophore receptor n=1 Tax=Massilia timonae CCUG 45783 TaxID=883126 RepID=K9DYZ2_9BURK|nr:TonB-dependent siderophore receptor [Massilia timonae]EKU83832.1 TonB-dependent siderophore receptor [Massilia timonae CCUG 45783]
MNTVFPPRPLAAVVALLCAAGAFAQDLPTVTIRGAAGEEGLALDRQNTTGSRLDISALDLPASAESLSAATIAARGDLLVKDAVTRSTGVTDSSSPGSGISYSARGFNGNNAIAMLENGQRLLVGSSTAAYPADPWGYETIEVLRGPGSVVQGSGATGAVINAVRKAPRRASSLEILGGIGGGESLRAGIGATGALGEQGAFRIDAYAGRSDGFIDRGESRHGKILTSMTTTLAPGVTLYAQLDHAEQEPIRYFGTPLVNGGLAERLRDQNYNAGDAVLRFVDDKAVARLHWQPAPNLEISNELAYFTSRRDWRNIESYAYDAMRDVVERSDYIGIRHDQEQTANRLEARWKTGANQVVAGWEASTINFRHINNSPYGGASTVAPTGFDPGSFWDTPDPFRPNFATDTTTHAFYLEDAYRVNERLLLTAGARHDRYQIGRRNLLADSGHFGTTLRANSVRVGASWKLAPDTSLYGQVSTGSDPVTSLLSMTLANSRFKLTDARQVEGGVKQMLAGGLAEWTAALYRIRKDDIITRDPDNPALSRQGGSQTSRGAEVSASVSLAPGWRMDANLAYTDAEFDELLEAGNVSRAGNRPADVPKVSSNLWLTHRAGDWRTSAGLRYVGERFISNANTQALPAYTTLDASLGWALSRNVQLQLNVRNLTDKLYAITSYGSSQYLLGDERHAELTVHWRY